MSVIYGEKVVKDGKNYGIYMDGTLVSLDDLYYNDITFNYWPMYWYENVDVVADWSDNLVLHQWEAGDKIRTEVILQYQANTGIHVFTVSASFMIEKLVDGKYVNVWDGTTLEGLWADGPTDAYSAEVNQVGTLLYGYNWDTRGLTSGTYKLTFTLLDVSEDLPKYREYITETDYVEYAIDYAGISIQDHVDPEPGADNYLIGIDTTLKSTSIVIELLEK